MIGCLHKYTDRYTIRVMETLATSEPGNRSLLLQQACMLFSRRGYDAVGVLEIAQSASVSKPTLYHYFEHKLGLLTAIIKEFGAPLVASIEQASDYQRDLPLTLQKLALAFRNAARTNPDFYRLLLALHFTPPEHEAHRAAAPLMQKLHDCVEQVFKLAVVQHGNMADRSRAYALSFLGMAHTIVGMELRGTTLADHELRLMVQWYQHGIYS